MVVFVRHKTGLGPDIKLGPFGIHWRGWRHSPLFRFRKYTAHFCNGIVFGTHYTYGTNCYYFGWLIIAKEVKCQPDFIQRVNKGTWNSGKRLVLKHIRGLK